MTHVQISISRKAEANFTSQAPYHFFFRTDWMEPDEAMIVLQELQSSFPSPRWQITINERTTTQTTQTL